MSASNQQSLVNLQVRAQDQATELYVIDGKFNLVQRSLGYMNANLTPGIYKVVARAGYATQEQHVVLREGAPPQTATFPPIEFASPVPISNTAKTHEYHMAAATTECAKVHVSVGHGSSIFVFARDWTAVPAGNKGRSHVQPARGLTLRDAQGRLLADIAKQSNKSDSPYIDPWAACNVEVDPGLYRLRLDSPVGVLEQTIVASPGWQTQIFLLQRLYGATARSKRANLLQASILLSQNSQFNPDAEDVRLTELARLGLMNRRQVLPTEATSMLWEKYNNPMLGIYGAFLHLQGKQPDFNLLATVVGNLRRLLGSHPDVEALALQLAASPIPPPAAINTDGSTGYVYKLPPMLRKSWSIVLGATVKQPSLVPRDSFASRVANRLWGEGPWLLWMAEDKKTAEAPAPTLQAGESDVYQEALKSQLVRLESEKRQSSSAPSREMLPESTGEPAQNDVAGYVAGESTVQATATTLSQLGEPEVEQLVQVLRLPRSNIEEMLEQLSGATGESPPSSSTS